MYLKLLIAVLYFIGAVRNDPVERRTIWCSEEVYKDMKLPKTTIIITYHNEEFVVLHRLMTSILETTPTDLYAEMILIDDFSDPSNETVAFAKFLEGKLNIRVIRTTSWQGSDKARALACNEAKTDVLTFLSPTAYCTVGWLQPQLETLMANQTTVALPFIDIIDYDTRNFSNSPFQTIYSGVFDWNLKVKFQVTKDQRRMTQQLDPIYTPTMVAGIFSINRAFYKGIRAFESGLKSLSASNLELSFKVWMCGGKLAMLPCSHVGFIIRRSSDVSADVERQDMAVVSESWMDDFSEQFFNRGNNALYRPQVNHNIVMNRKVLGMQLHCKNFEWYVRNIFPELFQPTINEMRNMGASGHYCLTMGPPTSTKHSRQALISFCNPTDENQKFLRTNCNEIRRGLYCLDFPPGKRIQFWPCHGRKKNQEWLYDIEKRIIMQGTSKLCLELNENEMRVTMEKCKFDYFPQQWIIPIASVE